MSSWRCGNGQGYLFAPKAAMLPTGLHARWLILGSASSVSAQTQS